MTDHTPGPSYQHPQPRQHCSCGVVFTGDTIDAAVDAFREHVAAVTRPERQVGLDGVARARQALADTIAQRGDSA